MKKNALIAICAVVFVAAAGALAYSVYSNSDYAVYTSAFKKTFNVNSMELSTSVNASADDSKVSASGSFKLKDMNTTPQFVNTMTIDGQTVTQFCDGEYIYTDDGSSKNKLKMGETPQPAKEKGDSDFSFDTYISEFAGMLDASKIRELSAMEPVEEKYVDGISVSKSGDRRKYDVTLLPQAVDTVVASFLSENLSDESLAPEVDVKTVSYAAIVENGYVSEVAFKLDLDVIPPNETDSKDVTVDFKIVPVNPGKSTSFTLPDTEGF